MQCMENKMTEVEKLKAQLEIAVEVLKYYANKRKCQKALEKIKEVENEYLCSDKGKTSR